MAKPFSWRAWKLFHRTPGSSHCALAASSCTYTQILKDKNGEPLEVARHGLNRDAVRVALIGSQVGVIALADGCGLVYWSEIAAQIIVNEFVTYVEKHLPKDGPYTPTAMKTLLKTAIQSVNQNMLTWKHPKTKAKCNVLDKGGNSTLVVAIVFPFIEDDSTSPHHTRTDPSNSSLAGASSLTASPSSSSSDLRASSSSVTSQSSHETPSKPSRKHSNASESENRFGVVFTGMGDSELYLFKCNEPEKPAKEKRHHSSQNSVSMSSLSDDHRRTVSPPSSPRDGQDQHDDSGTNQPGAQKLKKYASVNKEKKPTNQKSAVYHSLPGHNAKRVEAFVPSPRETSASVSVTPTPKTEIRPLRSSSGTAVQSTSQASPTTSSPIAETSASPRFPLTSPREGRTTRSVSFSSARPVAINHGSNPITSSAPTGSGDGKFTFTTRIAPSSSAEDARSSSKPLALPPLQLPTSSSLPSTPTDAPKLGPLLLHLPSHDTSASSLSGSPTTHVVSHLVIPEVEDESNSGPQSPLNRSTEISLIVPSDGTSSVTTTEVTTLEVPSTQPSRVRQSSDPQSPHNVPSVADKESHSGYHTVSGRAKRYSKSYSDIPSFEEMNLSTGSLRLNFDAVSHGESHTDASGTSELTPRLPCGTWHKIMSDSGKSPFLPFPGLRERSIPEPNFVALSPGDSVVACSDGVVQSYENHEVQWPDIMTEQYECKEGLERTVQTLLQSTMAHHKMAQMDPDDVTIGAIKVTSYAKRKRSDVLRVAPVRDLTSQFAPEFAQSEYKRDYLSEFLSEYPKPKDKPM